MLKHGSDIPCQHYSNTGNALSLLESFSHGPHNPTENPINSDRSLVFSEAYSDS